MGLTDEIDRRLKFDLLRIFNFFSLAFCWCFVKAITMFPKSLLLLLSISVGLLTEDLISNSPD